MVQEQERKVEIRDAWEYGSVHQSELLILTTGFALGSYW